MSIQRLTDERKKLELGLQDNLIIRKYDFIAPHSIIIRDRYDDQAWIRIEDRPLGSVSNDIPSYSKYKKEDETFFQKYSKEYDIIYNHSILLNINS